MAKLKVQALIAFLESEELGRETFAYDSTKEALKGVERLILHAKKQTAIDGFVRKVGMQVEPYGLED